MAMTLQGQTMGSSDITTAMDFNCRLMEVQIQLVEELTALQVSKHFWCPKPAGVIGKEFLSMLQFVVTTRQVKSLRFACARC